MGVSMTGVDGSAGTAACCASGSGSGVGSSASGLIASGSIVGETVRAASRVGGSTTLLMGESPVRCGSST